MFRLWHFQLLAIILLRLNYVDVRARVGSIECFDVVVVMLFFAVCTLYNVHLFYVSPNIFFCCIFLYFFFSFFMFHMFSFYYIQNDEIVKMIMVRLFGDDCL